MSNSCFFSFCLFIAAPGETQSAENPVTALDIFAFLCQKFGWLGPGRWWSHPSKFITSKPDVLLIIKITKYQNCLIVTTVPGISFQSTSKVYMDSQRLHGVEIGFGIGRTTKSFGAFARPPSVARTRLQFLLIRLGTATCAVVCLPGTLCACCSLPALLLPR